ncbi:MAG: YbaB/EbfC family nucleoid-associated protein [Geminicoccaceae bacterium]|nr:YbaB/EbfC family nucleoid-associated protein [Geminicoccaceae bacterium]MCX8100096.1 YbaB/EbfC family nucleoid-associated protein [Geminicoccaceae bacterium]MDW8371112.1 YbaB/EbfC family nucleoid-associated protein [Geminicoccaceae bacterium]
MKNLSNMLKEAQKLQQRMQEMQQRLAETEMTGSAGGGLVTVTMSGKGELKKVTIDKSLVDPNEVEILEDLIVAAANDAKAKLEAEVAQEMQKMTGGLPLPPGMKLPF